MMNELLDDAENRMKGAIHSLDNDLSGFRTGRASPQLVEKLAVEMYGTQMVLNQMASISVPEPQQLAIRPYDVNSISAIERAIMKSDLGIMPNNDGKIIRLNMPRLSEQRRKELTKLAGRRVEDGKVAVRNVRRDIMNDMRDFHKEGEFTKDELKRGQDKLQALTDKHVKQIDELGKKKEAEIMEV